MFDGFCGEVGPGQSGEERRRRAEQEQEAKRVEALLLEEQRLKFQFEEMMTLKSELERKKRTERREIAELQVFPALCRTLLNCLVLKEEIATMQTLYQYRTYSVDSSESSSEEEEGEQGREQRQARLDTLRRLQQVRTQQTPGSIFSSFHNAIS